MTPEEFFAWQLHQEECYELVGGVPVLRRRDARQQHDPATVNIIVSLHTQLRGSGCRPMTADIYDGLTFGPRWDPAGTPPEG
ncbi:hypothetical protein [Methylobacterium sp. R2-1]|uniref:hypothetical protein n=1 Tax=Methylobacterium sp. R2-1 TaxID=2587064 RepID=UPI0018487DF3|nr:hypothetical protein [Methylobacterium sp. R2-1]MBB2961674.1 hypothetical protein [Methylobacterium sp. R2-1]